MNVVRLRRILRGLEENDSSEASSPLSEEVFRDDPSLPSKYGFSRPQSSWVGHGEAEVSLWSSSLGLGEE